MSLPARLVRFTSPAVAKVVRSVSADCGREPGTAVGAVASRSAEAALALPLTEELLACSGISRGMRVLVLGRGFADVALLVAERVGQDGGVVAMHEDRRTVGEARRRAILECCDRVSFRTGPLPRTDVDAPFDAVFGRFFLMYQRDPVQAIRRAASMVHDGGRIVFQEWHYESIRWGHTSSWPLVPLYRQFVRSSIEALRRRRAHTDMGLRLVNAFTEAGLAIPSVRTDLRAVHGAGSLGYTFFEDEICEWLPGTDTFAERLERETTASGGHLFLPLQVGAWTVRR